MTNLLTVLESAVIPLPAYQLTALLIILGVCMVLRVPQVGIIVAYLFCYGWGWRFCMRAIASNHPSIMAGYFIFGGLVCLLTVIGMMRQSSPDQE